MRKKLAMREEPVVKSEVSVSELLGESDAMLSHLQYWAIKTGSYCRFAKIFQNRGLLLCVGKSNTDIATASATRLIHKPKFGGDFNQLLVFCGKYFQFRSIISIDEGALIVGNEL
jgi:hypothetical protein